MGLINCVGAEAVRGGDQGRQWGFGYGVGWGESGWGLHQYAGWGIGATSYTDELETDSSSLAQLQPLQTDTIDGATDEQVKHRKKISVYPRIFRGEFSTF